MTEEAGSADAGNPVEASAPAEATSATPWIDNVSNPDTRAWAEAKGLQNGTIDNVLGSYHNLEKLMGADKAGRTVTLLGDDATDDQRNEFYTRLGRPEDATGYGLAPPEGQDGAFAEWASNTFHAAGLSGAQAAMIAEAWETHRTTTEQGVTEAEQLSATNAEATLKKEWGAAYEQKLKGIDTAAAKLGFTQAQLEGLRASMGPVGAMKFVDSLNTQLGDHDFDYGEVQQTNLKTPEQARQELSELSMNREFTEAWLDKQHPGHAAAVSKKQLLAKQAAGVSP